MERVFYLGYYNTLENRGQKRPVAPTAVNKMTYIISALERSGKSVEVLSPCATHANRFHKGKTIPIGEKSRLKLFTTFPHRPQIVRKLGLLYIFIQLFFYCLFHIKKKDTVIVYHSLSLMKIVKMLKRICKFRLIIEAEEIYGNVSMKPEVSQKELAYFQIADGYLFPAKELEQTVNLQNKPYVLIHGTYQSEERVEPFQEPEWKDKIHCVYAGTLDPLKGGAAMAAQAARYLPDNYYIHILGAGGKSRVDLIRAQIEEIKTHKCCGVSYDGCLRGKQFSRFLQSCQIGLSTQTPDGDYNNTSFPSKILTYLTNGLKIVTVRIPVIESSAVNEYMHYFEDHTPEGVAAAIQEAVAMSSEKDVENALSVLDKQCVEALSELLNSQ